MSLILLSRAFIRNVPIKSVQRLCLRTTSCLRTSPPESEKFVTLYRFPYIHGCSVIHKVKRIHLFAVGFTIPIAFVFSGLNELQDASTIVFFSLISTAIIFVAGRYTSRFVGYIYVSEDCKKVKISYVDLWGQRRDAVHSAEEIFSLTSASKPMNKFYMILKTSNSAPYKISLKYGEIVNIKLFKDIFKISFDDENNYFESDK